MKKMFMLLMTLVLALALLAACGQTEPPTDTDVPASEETLAPESAVVRPLKQEIDTASLKDGTYAVSLAEGDVAKAEDGAVQMKAKLYIYDVYDMVDVAGLKEGSKIERLGEEITVDTIERRENGDVVINGGIENGGFELATDDTTVFYEIRENDAKAYYEIGEVVLPVAEEFVFTDASDLDSDPLVYTAEEFVAPESGIAYHFVPNNAKIIVQDGAVIALNRTYIP